ncbi:hypothetical protein GF337_18675 [candidate division KSB1 bacterium]|nr:hypothetical protein [candidate division KSB1 bacterium]
MSPITASLNSELIHNSEILEVRELTPRIFRMRFHNSFLARNSLPGQFINIKVNSEYNPLWRRPFSIHQINSGENWADILFKVIGKGTDELSRMNPGESLDFIGPLGNSFTIKPDSMKVAYMVAGGLGIAPMLILGHALLKLEIHPMLFYGVRTESEFCCLDDFESAGIKVHLATEDGSRGYKGFVTALIESTLRDMPSTTGIELFSCGPNPMLLPLGTIADRYNVPCQVSLETLMGCGVGACLGCGVKANQNELKYLYVCTQGPVFNSNEINLSE